MWNALPASVIQSGTLSSFKAGISDYYGHWATSRNRPPVRDTRPLHRGVHFTLLNCQNYNSSGRSAIYRLPTRKLLAVDRIFICGFVLLISVVAGNGNLLHFKSLISVGKPSASYVLTPPKPVLLSRPAYIVREENGEFCVAVAPATWTAGILT